MGWKKTVTLTIQCEGTCGSPPQTVRYVPPGWNRIKVHRASAPNHAQQVTHQILLCPACTQTAINLLIQYGFAVQGLEKPEEK